MTAPNTTKPSPPVAPKPKGRVWGRPFQPGQSGNPGGKRKAPVNLAELTRDATPRAIQTLIEIMDNKAASFAVRAYCAEKVLDRSLGKPVQQTNVNVGMAQRSIRELSDQELMQIIENGRRATAALPAPPAIEVEVEPSVQPKLMAEQGDEAA